MTRARFANIEAGFLYLTVDEVEYRVYVERAGSGIPLLLQHTAGSDSRQWRHLMEDPDITRDFQLIAYDLPFHGKSTPPAALRYWENEYRLRKEFFEKFIVALAHELELDRPIYMGCSMGGHLAADLALDHPEEFRAVIGIEAGVHSHGVEGLLKWLWHPRLSNDSKSALMHTLCAPQSPEALRRETIYCYSQGAPVTFKGDLHFYLIEHDQSETAKDIDTAKLDVYILNGEYDWSGHPAGGKALADMIPGAKWLLMKEMGHFPMSENPQGFKEYILPILREIKAKGDSTAPRPATSP